MISPFPYCLREGQGKVKKKSEDAKNEKQKKGMFSHVLYSYIKFVSLLYCLYDSFKSFRVVHCKVGKSFSVQFNAFFVKFPDKL